MTGDILTQAKFGDRFTTRDGKTAIMWHHDSKTDTFKFIVDDVNRTSSVTDNQGVNIDGETDMDIVSKHNVDFYDMLDEIQHDYCEENGYTYAEDEWDELIGWRTKEELADEICQAIEYGFETLKKRYDELNKR